MADDIRLRIPKCGTHLDLFHKLGPSPPLHVNVLISAYSSHGNLLSQLIIISSMLISRYY